MHRPISVLLADDDPGQCETLADLLSEYDCEVVPCSDPFRAEALGRSTRFDLVLIDLKMAGMSGIELIRSIRSHAHGCIVVLTGMAGTSIKHTALTEGADAFLEKPVDIPRLLTIVRDVEQTGDCRGSTQAADGVMT